MMFSIISPVYNSERYLDKNIKSVLNQTYNNWEYILVNDGSNDNSLNVLKKYAKLDKRIKHIEQINSGPGLARNAGLDLACGDYIIFLDSDDYVERDYLCLLADVCKEEVPDVVFIDLVQEDENGKILKRELMSSYKNLSGDRMIRWQMTGKLPWGGCRKVVSRKLIENNQIRYSKDLVGEEALYSFLLLKKAIKISFLEKICYHYVNYPNSQSKKGNDDPWGQICENIKCYLGENNLYAEYRKTINSFGYTALIVSINRMSLNYNFLEAVERSRKALKKFRDNYTFELDTDSLEIRAILVLPFARFGFVLPIVIAAKLKQLLSGKANS